MAGKEEKRGRPSSPCNAALKPQSQRGEGNSVELRPRANGLELTSQLRVKAQGPTDWS